MKNKTFFVLGLILLIGLLQAQGQTHPEIDKDHKPFKPLLTEPENVENVSPSRVINNFKASAEDYGNPLDLKWMNTFGGSGGDYGRGIITDESDNIYIIGSFNGRITLGADTYVSTGAADAIIAKFNKEGSFQWSTVIQPEGEFDLVDLYDICLDNAGNLYITGSYWGSANAGDTYLPYTDTYRLFYAKISRFGEILSAKYYDSYDTDCIGLEVEIDDNGYIYILGAKEATYPSDYHHPSIILKYNSSGALSWSQEHDESFTDFVIYGSNIYFAGCIYRADGYIDEDVSLSTEFGYQAFIAKADLDGDFKWATMAEVRSDQWGESYPTDITIDQYEYVYMTGYFYNNVIFGNDELVDDAGRFFITKCNAIGQFVWAKNFVFGISELCTDNAGNPMGLTGNSIIEFSSSSGDTLWTKEVTDKNSDHLTINTTGNILTTGSFTTSLYLNQMDGNANEQWLVSANGNSGSGTVRGMAADDFGNVYFLGSTSISINYNRETVNRGQFICKQYVTGRVKWIRQFPESGISTTSFGNPIIVDKINQKLYITGVLYDTLVIPGKITLIPEAEARSVVILKYDLDGNYIWALKEDFAGEGITVCTDQSGNVILSGTFDDTISIGNTELISMGDRDVFFAKYNANGDFLWAKRAGGESIEWEALISTDADDNIYLSSEFYSENVTVDNYQFTMKEGDGNIIFAKLGPNGDVHWVKSLAGSLIDWYDSYCWPTGMLTGPGGNIYMKGWHGDSVYFDDVLLTSPHPYNKFIAKISPSGNTIWAKSIQEYYWGFDYNQFDIDPAGNVYFGFYVRDTIQFGYEFMYVPEGRYDMIVAKYTSDGDLNWVKSIQGNESSYFWLSSVAVYNSSNIFAGGYFSSYLSLNDEVAKSYINHGFVIMLGDETWGVEEVYKRNNLGIEIYPNPSTGIVYLEFEKPFSGEIEIINSVGQVVRKYLISSMTMQQLDLSTLDKGVYVVHVSGENNSNSRRIILE